MKPFKHIVGSTVSLAVTSTSGRVQLTAAPKNSEFQVRLHNAGPALAFIKFGDVASTATTGNMPLPAGAVEVLTFETSDATPGDYLAAITAGGATTIYASVGVGY